MFIDYLSLMLVNTGAGLALLAHYLFTAPKEGHRRGWAAGFFAAGLLGVVTALPMVITWPLPGSFNIVYGEAALYLSFTFLAAAVTLTFEWEPLIPALFGVPGALYAIIGGFRILNLGMGSQPTVAMLGYVLTGLGGLLTVPAINYRNQRWWSILAALVLGIAAIIWLFTGYDAMWSHLADFAKYLPPTLSGGSK
jgi:putative membrane protein